MTSSTPPAIPLILPKIAIRFCMQCKWNLRAAYYAQELLSTFSDTLGEISLIPVTGGVFTINLYHDTTATSTGGGTSVIVSDTLIWDRKRDSGFPETKELKNRVRNVIEPGRDMGHVDRALKKGLREAERTDSGGDRHGGMGNVAGAVATLAGHAEHGDKKVAPKDCEECIEAARESEAMNDKF